MSWDLFVQEIPATAMGIDEIPEHFAPGPIGRRSAVLDVIGDVAPFADRSDASWVRIEGPTFSVEVDLGTDEELKSFALHVRGADESIGFVAEILGRLGLRALDPGSETGIFDPTSAAASLAAWRAYRSQVLGQSG